MAQIKRFLECLIPVTVCNLECPYCYIIQEDRRKMRLAELPYTPEQIGYALRPERLGGSCYISICGAGETMAQKEVIAIARELLKRGHYINITTNGTLSRRFDELIGQCGPWMGHVHVAFSMHYTELVRKGWVDVFFENFNKVKAAGGSVLLQLNLCDDYVPYIEEIQRLSVEKAGAWPQVALTRDETTEPFGIFTQGTEEAYLENGRRFASPLFAFTVKNFNEKRKEFCYAGDWSGVLNLQTGILTKCYAEPGGTDIFSDPDRPIPFEAVGKCCHNRYCVNSSHFMSLGVIPELDTPTYASLRDRPEAGWYSGEMREFLSGKLEKGNSKGKSRLRYYRGALKRQLTWPNLRQRLLEFGVFRVLLKIKRKLTGFEE